MHNSTILTLTGDSQQGPCSIGDTNRLLVLEGSGVDGDKLIILGTPVLYCVVKTIHLRLGLSNINIVVEQLSKTGHWQGET